jgi:cation:H+ antiporter
VRDGFVIASTTLLLVGLIGWDLRLDRHDGVILFVLLGVYLYVLFRQRKEHDETDAPEVPGAGTHGLAWNTAVLLAGLVAIVGGSHLLVGAASVIARGFGVSEWAIGVTIVAAGTSAPELATSITGVVKGRFALSAGNVIGSDIFNLLGVLGLAGILRPIEVDALARVSLAALAGMVFLVLYFMRTGWRLSRLEGLALIGVAMVRWAFDFSSGGGE